MSNPDITLHHLNSSRSDRLFWLLEELELPYNVRVYFRLPTRSAPPELKQITPFGKAPVVQLNGQTLTESGPIIHTLLSQFSSPNVESSPSQDSIFWSHFAEGSLMSQMQSSAVIAATSAGWTKGMMGGLGEEEIKGVSKYSKWLLNDYIGPQIQTMINEIEAFLSARPGMYFSGSDKPGEGDFMLFFIFNSIFAGTRKDIYKTGPATKAWWEMVMARPAAKRGMERLRKEEEAQKAKI